MTLRRRSLTLLEVLLAALLATGLFAILFKSWVQLESASLSSHRTAQAICADMSTRLWLQDHLSSVIVRGEQAALRWSGEVLEVICVHGSHPDPRLAGPVRLRVLMQGSSLVAQLESDEELWQSSTLEQQKLLWDGVLSCEFAAFGQQDQEQLPSWHHGPQEWAQIPLFAELQVERSQGSLVIPIFFVGEES